MGAGRTARRPLAREHVRLAARAPYGRRPYRHVPRALRMARLDSVGGEGSHARVRLCGRGVCKTGIRIFRLEEGDRPSAANARWPPFSWGRPPSGAISRRSRRVSSGWWKTMPIPRISSATTDFSSASRSPNRGRKVGEAKLGQDARGARGAKLDQRAKPGHSANSAENAKKEGKPAGLPSSFPGD